MKKIILVLADGFEEIEAISSADILRRADIDLKTVSINEDLSVKGAHDIELKADLNLKKLKSGEYDGVIIPGGMDGVQNLLASEPVIEIVRDFYEGGKMVAAICAGPMVLEKAGILKGKSAICYPGLEDEISSAEIKSDDVVLDGNLITSKGPSTAISFAVEIVGYLNGDKSKMALKKDLLIEK
ncbi:MAG: DJ-1/PfpI family protein [Tissierellia bacterium]|nr:DJ-1/PfpI family protein [Tissierellia bacterium]